MGKVDASTLFLNFAAQEKKCYASLEIMILVSNVKMLRESTKKFLKDDTKEQRILENDSKKPLDAKRSSG